MSTLDSDFEILCDDYDRLVALESLGVRPDYPAVCAIKQRWCLQDDDGLLVAQESTPMERAQATADGAAQGSLPDVYSRKIIKGAGRAGLGVAKAAGHGAAHVASGAGHLAAKGANAVGGKTLAVTKQLAGRFRDFAAELAKEQTDKLKEAISKATLLEKQSSKLHAQLQGQSSLHAHDVYTGSWTSKVCVEDKVDINGCLEFANNIGATESMVQQYTIHTRSVLAKSRKADDGELKRLGKSTGWAVKRAAGILGILDPFKTVDAYPYAGNVIIVKHHSGKIQWAVARDGDYGETIKQFSKPQCEAALKAIDKIVVTLRDRGVKRKAVGYSGIYSEVEQMKNSLEGLDGKELREATQRYKNALGLEDAFTTALVRVAEGLAEYVKQSVAKKA